MCIMGLTYNWFVGYAAVKSETNSINPKKAFKVSVTIKK